MRKNLPVSSYRLELSKHFTLKDAARLVPYLASMGIEMVYLSPYFENEKGSLNPYKILTPDHVNPVLGGNKGFETFAAAIKKFHLLHMIDLVPNHMGATVDNPWWYDLLKYGKSSKYAPFFDIDWDGASSKIVCPFLHDHSKIVKRGKELIVDGKRYPLKEGTEVLPLKDLLEQQHYILCHWKETSKRVNYRRFFDIADLVGLCMEEDLLFRRYHKQVFKWVSEHKIHGFRIDHPDGLSHPAHYLEKLDKKYHSLYIVCEKILQSNEFLREDWKTRGTVGYDALNTLNALFVDPSAEKKFDRIYHEFAGARKDPEILLADLKRDYMKKYLQAEIKMIARKIGKDHEEGLVEFLAHFPVYRSYVSPTSKKIHPLDVKAIRTSLRKCSMSKSEKEFFGKTFLTMPYRRIFIRVEQLMPAVFAKGFEDTFLYQYNRLVSLNEVGSSPTKFGLTNKEFHEINCKRAKICPESMITTSTHDTKRSCDVRMRISVLSEMPDLWKEKLTEWRKINGPFVDHNTEYFFYQTLIGLWPDKPTPPKEARILRERIVLYMLKAVREAKAHTDWIDSNVTYEKALMHFIETVLHNKAFWKSFYPFQEKTTLYGMYNSFSSLVLKMGMPGITDSYQGEELWRYDLVDPDNRRKVNFKRRAHLLKEIQETKNPPLLQWFELPHDGKLKMYLLWKGLAMRQKENELFLHGDYLPVETKDKHLIAFIRKKGKKQALIIAPRFYSQGLPILPKQKGWIDIFTGRETTPLPFSIRLKKA